MTRTFGLVPLATMRALCSTPNRCCSWMDHEPKAGVFTFSWKRLWVPTADLADESPYQDDLTGLAGHRCGEEPYLAVLPSRGL